MQSPYLAIKEDSCVAVRCRPARSAAACEAHYHACLLPTMAATWNDNERAALLAAAERAAEGIIVAAGGIDGGEGGTVAGTHPAGGWEAVAVAVGGGHTPAQCLQEYLRLKSAPAGPATAALAPATAGEPSAGAIVTVAAPAAIVPASERKEEEKHFWTPAEDATLLQLISKHGFAWDIISSEMGIGKKVRDGGSGDCNGGTRTACSVLLP